MPKDYIAILTRDKDERPLETHTFYDREVAARWARKYAQQYECQGIVCHELDWFDFTKEEEEGEED